MNEPESTIAMDTVRYWRKGQHTQNFGDYLAEFFLDRLFYRLAPHDKKVFIVGSVIDDLFASPDAKDTWFWGCGVRNPNGLSDENARNIRVFGSRGPLTSSELKLGTNAPHGDAGLLLPLIYSPTIDQNVAGRSICIPHFNDDRSDQELKAASGCGIVLRTNIPPALTSVETFIDIVASADFVLSASLHGAIAAAAYHRPFGFWDAGKVDLPFKWEDISALLRIPCLFYKNVEDAKIGYQTSIEPTLQLPSFMPILSAAPLLIRSSVLLRALKSELGTEVSNIGLDKLNNIIADFNHNDDIRDQWVTKTANEFQSMRDQLRHMQRQADVLLQEIDALRRQRNGEQRAVQVTSNIERRLSEISKTHQKIDIKRRALRIAAAPARLALRNSSRGEHYLRQAARYSWYFATFQFSRIPARKIMDQLAKKASGKLHSKTSAPWQYHDGRPVALIIDSVYPTPNRDSGSIDAVNLVNALHSLGYQVIFITTMNSEASARAELEKLGAICPDVRGQEHLLFESIKPFLAVAFLSRVWCGGVFMEAIRRSCPTARIIFNTVDLHYIREERMARLRNDLAGIHLAAKTKKRELTLTRLADATIVVSYKEHEVLRELAPGCDIFTLPLARRIAHEIDGFEQRSDIAFIGTYTHEPNVDAVLWFLEQIWPLVRRNLPDAKFIALGGDMPNSIATRCDVNFIPHGYADDLQATLRKFRVMVAPLRAGAGAKGKVATALAYGVPCVASPFAVEGMNLCDRVDILVANSPEEYADRIHEVYTTPSLWTSLSTTGLKTMSQNYSLLENNRRIESILVAIGAIIPRPPHKQDVKNGALAL